MEKTASVQTQSLSGDSKQVWNGLTVVRTSAENSTMIESDSCSCVEGYEDYECRVLEKFMQASEIKFTKIFR